MTALRVGSTTVAFFQKAASVARASGSALMPLWIAVELRRLSLFQLVPGLGLILRTTFDALPVGAPFLRFRAPCRDDASFVMFPVRIDDRDFQAVYQPYGVGPDFFVVETVIDLFKRRTLENTLGVTERDAVANEVGAVLVFVPSVAHVVYLLNVNIAST